MLVKGATACIKTDYTLIGATKALLIHFTIIGMSDNTQFKSFSYFTLIILVQLL